MQRALAITALILLSCTACATVDEAPTDARMVEAQQAYDEASRLEGEGKYAEAVPLAERALELREAALGERHPEVASCLNLLADLHREQGAYARAEPLVQRALAIREEKLGKDHPDVATSLTNLANLYAEQGQYARAQPLYERALAIREEALGKHHPRVASALNNLALIYVDQGFYVKAKPLYERALAIQEETRGKNHPDVASTLNNLARLYRVQGLYGEAEPLYVRALAIWEEALGKQHPLVARPLSNLATLYQIQGFYSRAEPLQARALGILEEALGKQHLALAPSLNNLALLYQAQGLYGRAESLLERALGIHEAVHGKDNPQVADSLDSLATIYVAQGLYARAEPLYERVLAIREKTLGKQHLAVAGTLNNLALLYQAQELHGRAEPLLERALGIHEVVLGKDNPQVVVSISNLAMVYMAQGDYARAEPLLERALALAEATLGKNHPKIAAPLNNLARLYEAQGLYGQAEPLQERALGILEENFGRNHPDVATVLNNLARLRVAQERLADALTLYARGLAASEGHLRQEVLSFSEARLSSVLNLLRAQEEYLYSIARAHPGDSRVRQLALSAALLRKGRSVEESAELSRIIYSDLGQDDRAAFERLRALRTQLSMLSLSGPGSLSPADYQGRLKELADKGDKLERDLARRSAPLRALSSQPSAEELLSRVTQALPRDGVLIEFVAYGDSPLVLKPGALPTQASSQLRYLALLLFADGRTHAVDLGPAEPIDNAALRLHRALSVGAVSARADAQALYKLAFRPLVPHLGKVKRLFISPDSQLALVPFAALHDGNRFLVDAVDITYLTSGSELLPRSEEIPPARGVVVFADPDFSASPAAPSPVAQATPAPLERSSSMEHFFSSLRSDLRDRPWPPLPGARKEAETIHRLFPQAQLLLGPAATKHALLTLETPGILHIATHGFLLEDGAAPAATRAVSHFGAVAEAGPQQRPPDPLLRSGLVLAGAGAGQARPGSRRHEDSLVTALELAGLDLWGTQLVVLSACDTGRGDVKLGQGVYGLRRSLVVAGAESLVTSLWKVNDETTRELMEAYYRNLLAGQDRFAALRQAMRTLRQKHPHPHYWAPFVPIGKDGPLSGLNIPRK